MIFQTVKSQVIMGFNGPVALDLNATIGFIERKIKDAEEQDYCLQLVQSVHAEYVHYLGDKK